MKLTVITPCIAPTRNYIRLLDESAKRQGIELDTFGIGQPFVDWRHMLLTYTVPEMKRLHNEGVTHVLYVDGRDSLFVAPLAEIMRKYHELDAPACLMSADDQAPLEAKVNAGGYVGELDYLIDLWTGLALRHTDDADYQNWLWKEWPVQGITCDVTCAIFQSVDGGVATNGGRFVNTVTGSHPCVLHFRGGYSDPVTGREHRIKPVLEALYG